MRTRRGYLENIVKWTLAVSICFTGLESSSSVAEMTGETLRDPDHMILPSKLRRKESIAAYWKLIKEIL